MCVLVLLLYFYHFIFCSVVWDIDLNIGGSSLESSLVRTSFIGTVIDIFFLAYFGVRHVLVPSNREGIAVYLLFKISSANHILSKGVSTRCHYVLTRWSTYWESHSRDPYWYYFTKKSTWHFGLAHLVCPWADYCYSSYAMSSGVYGTGCCVTARNRSSCSNVNSRILGSSMLGATMTPTLTRCVGGIHRRCHTSKEALLFASIRRRIHFGPFTSITFWNTPN